MAKDYGRTLSSERLCMAKPYHRGNKYSIISAISIEKIVASIYCENSVDGEIFSGFIEQCLVPHLESRHKIIMDNVAFHKIKEVEELVKKTGAEIIYLPPYSPDYSPIELMWSKIKNYLRKYAARTSETFQTAMNYAFNTINPNDLKGWFSHCGYEIK
jgi:transposase